MSAVALFGALETGLIYGLVALGVFLTFRVLQFPDLTVEGSFPLGGAIAAAWIVGGGDAWMGCAFAFLGGGAAGWVTAFLSVRAKILHLVASILTMIALFSINIRIMGRPNISLLGETSIFSAPEAAFDFDSVYFRPLLLALLTLAICALAVRKTFLHSEFGLGMRAAGANPRMLRAQGGDPGYFVFCGLALSNGLVALAGALFAQANGFAGCDRGRRHDCVRAGGGYFGRDRVSRTVFRGRKIWILVFACIVGSVMYRLAVALALSVDVGLRASDLNLATAILVALALVAPQIKSARRLRAAIRSRAR